MKAKKNIIFIISIAAILFSCSKDFETINTNPNFPNNVHPSFLLRQVIYDFGEQMSYEGFVAGDLLSQHRTAVDFNLFDRHALKSPQLGGNPWDAFYINLRDNQLLLEEAEKNHPVYQGPALILKAYLTAGLTDLYGDVPYFEAFGSNKNVVNSSFNSQESIYKDENGILDNLDKGIAAINAYNGIETLEGDILYEGNLKAWIKLANSLKIKYLIRISNKTAVSEELKSIYNSGNYIAENAENASFNFTNSNPNSFRLAQLRAGDFNNFVLSETMEAILTTLNDPRIAVLFRPFANAETSEFNGLINGIDASQTSIELANYSLAGTIFREDTSTLEANFITAWETLFCLAEAAEKGYIKANAKQLYNQAVTLAFEYWHTPMPDDYLSGSAAYNAENTTALQQIITQKWIANIINGYEGWVEWRRTGYPELKPVQASLNNGEIPIRMPYPANEENLNAKNYQQIMEATQNNSINVPVWWNQ